jgi:hypothetical protein
MQTALGPHSFLFTGCQGLFLLKWSGQEFLFTHPLDSSIGVVSRQSIERLRSRVSIIGRGNIYVRLRQHMQNAVGPHSLLFTGSQGLFFLKWSGQEFLFTHPLDSSIGVVSRLRIVRLRNRVSILGRGNIYVRLLQHMQNALGPHSSLFTGCQCFFSWRKAAGGWSWTFTRKHVEVNNAWSCTSDSLYRVILWRKGTTFRNVVLEGQETYAIRVGYTKSGVEILSLIPPGCSKEYFYLVRKPHFILIVCDLNRSVVMKHFGGTCKP